MYNEAVGIKPFSISSILKAIVVGIGSHHDVFVLSFDLVQCSGNFFGQRQLVLTLAALSC